MVGVQRDGLVGCPQDGRWEVAQESGMRVHVKRPVVSVVGGFRVRARVASLMPEERVQQRTVQQHVDVPVPQIFEECVEVVSLM